MHCANIYLHFFRLHYLVAAMLGSECHIARRDGEAEGLGVKL